MLRLETRPDAYVPLAYGRIRRSLDRPGTYDVEAVVVDVVKEKTEKLWIPLSEFGHYPIGSVVGRRLARRIRTGQIHHEQPMRFNEAVAYATDGIQLHMQMYNPKEEEELPWGKGTLAYLNQNGQRVAIPPIEFLRFYSRACCNLIDELSKLRTLEPDLSKFCDPKESFWADEETMVIAPRLQFSDPASVVQIVLFLTNDELRGYILAALHVIERQLSLDDYAVATLPMPDPDLVLTVQSHRVSAHDDLGAVAPIELVQLIKADHRKSRISKLVIRLPHGASSTYYQGEIVLPSGLGESEAGSDASPVGPETQFNRTYYSNGRTIRLSGRPSRLFDLFPGWEGLQTERIYPQGTAKPRPVSPAKPRNLENAGLASTLGGTSAGKVPTVQLRSREPFPKSPAERFSSAFAKSAIADTLDIITFETAILPPMMQCFVTAGHVLIEDIDQSVLASLEPCDSTVDLFALPPSWGGIAALGPNCLQRVFSAFPLRFENGLVWVVDIARRNAGEKFAIGLISTIEPCEPVEYLARIMQAVCARSKRRRADEPRGMWPDAAYTDVRFGRLIHSMGRRFPSNLAQDIRNRARDLLRPETEF